MEQHPVPQNVTSFQFKLIGDITLKQFAYVAGGVIIAYICTKLGFMPALFQYALAVVFLLLGFGLAFVPIEQRPMDRWLIAFFKSIYMPTQFVWKKNNLPPEILNNPLTQAAGSTATQLPTGQPELPTAPPEKPTIPVAPPPLAPMQPPPNTPPNAPEPVNKSIPPLRPIPLQQPSPPQQSEQLKPPPMPVPPASPNQPRQMGPTAPAPRPHGFAVPPSTPPPPLKITPPNKPNSWMVGAPPVNKPALTVNMPPAPPKIDNQVIFHDEKPKKPTETENPQVEKLKTDYQSLEKQLTDQMQAMRTEMEKSNINKQRLLELQQLLTQLLSEKDRLSNELTDLRRKVSVKSQPQPVTPNTYKTIAQERPTVKIVPPNIALQSGVPQLTTYPNVITGIVKDSQGILLPNMIITVKDKEGLPVRALKTNKLGQFAASTPLANGTYVIELEDPKGAFKFDRIEVSLSNQVLPPLEISAVSEKDVMRQKLSQEIFGKKSI